MYKNLKSVHLIPVLPKSVTAPYAASMIEIKKTTYGHEICNALSANECNDIVQFRTMPFFLILP